MEAQLGSKNSFNAQCTRLKKAAEGQEVVAGEWDLK